MSDLSGVGYRKYAENLSDCLVEVDLLSVRARAKGLVGLLDWNSPAPTGTGCTAAGCLGIAPGSVSRGPSRARTQELTVQWGERRHCGL